MAHQIIQFLTTLLGVVAFGVFIFAVSFVVMDVIEVYLKFREHVLKGDLAKRKDDAK